MSIGQYHDPLGDDRGIRASTHFSVRLQPSGAVSKLAARQTLPCQPLFVRPGQGRLSRAIIRTRAEEGEKGEKPDLKGFFTGSSNAVSLSRLLVMLLNSVSHLFPQMPLQWENRWNLQSRGYTEEDSAGQSNIFAVEVPSPPCAYSGMCLSAPHSLPIMPPSHTVEHLLCLSIAEC